MSEGETFMADDASAWDERLGWAFGLIAEEPADRELALVRLSEAKRAVHDALDRFNELWWLTRPLGTEEQYRESAFLEAGKVHSETQAYSLPEALWSRPIDVDVTEWPGLPYALLYLEWEARYPQAWTRHAKGWGTKEGLIRRLAVTRHDEWVKTKLTDLVEMAVNRAYRCKDREYVRVARAVDSDDLRGRLGAAACSDNPWGRTHASYVLWLLDNPDVPNSRHVWRNWLAKNSER
jgi:hypothetical protein